MSAPNSRKRTAPAASPIFPYQQRNQQPYANENGVAGPALQWKGDGAEFAETTAQTALPFNLMPSSQSQLDPVPTPSNTLTRRDTNQALVPTHNRKIDTSLDPWAGYNNDNTLLQRDNEGRVIEQESIETLEEMAQKAKREAQAKRKSIPPFVQKLSSFLEEPKNEHFIRWSEKGDSFFVLDEDEFAKRLIPELFKHNNYASFVRQLNMYGFHKRVGLSDNSMRASERKNKSPSEYYNPFFRRGHPNLLWLINKPKGKPKGGSNKHKFTELDGDSDDEQMHDDGAGQQIGPGPNTPAGRALPPAAPDSQAMPKKEMNVIRDELGKVREQQKRIMGAITQLQQNNNDLYNQAILFQNQHDRHQNSINAILKFLANVFRKTLEDQGNMQSVSDIIASMITNQGQQPTQQGSVFDLGDLFQSELDPTSTPGGTHKRARGLLPPIPNRGVEAAQSISHHASTGSSPYFPVGSQNAQIGHVTELLDGGEIPPSLRHELENNPHERMMKIINEHNATTKSGLDLPEAADLVANVPHSLSHDQRNTLVDMMGGQNAASASLASARPQSQHQHQHHHLHQHQHQSPITSSANGPPLSPSRPRTARVSPAPADAASMPSMSPIMRSPQMTPPSLNQISTNQIDLDQLQKLQREQDAKIQELSEMLGPLSPSGRIPGLGDASDGYFDPPNVDLDQFFDSNAFLNDTTFGTDGTDFNFGLDAGGAGVDTLGEEDNPNNGNSNDNTNNSASSPTGAEDIKLDDVPLSPLVGTKRRKVG
ncbi:hypothetical protein E4U21_002530 [Claviceps maximensis]|nr:hypothetical protein E4U21_002530 [Claviceps maximensis]